MLWSVRYNEKQARIAERRRVNYEKKLVVGELEWIILNQHWRWTKMSDICNFCRKGSNAIWRRAVSRSFPLQLTYRTTSSSTRSRWGSGWSAPMTPPELPSVARGASAGGSSMSTLRSTLLLSRPKLCLGKFTCVVLLPTVYFHPGFGLFFCITRWVFCLESLKRNTRPWWVSLIP